MSNFRWLRACAASIVTLAFSTPAPAQGTAEVIEQLRSQIRALSQRVDELQRQQQKQNASLTRRAASLDQKVSQLDLRAAAAQAAQMRFVSKGPRIRPTESGLFVSSPQPGNYSLHMGGWVQVDGRFYTSQDPVTGTGNPSTPAEFLIRRARTYWEGNLGQNLDYRLMTDFGQGTTTLQDAYGDLHYKQRIFLRLGKFKEPVGLERLQDDRYLEFVERSYVSDLVPDRDIGVMLWGQLLDNRLLYQFALVNVGPDNTATVDTESNNAKDFAGRLLLHPFGEDGPDCLREFALGFAGTYGSEKGTGALDSYKSEFQNVIFRYSNGVTASGDRYRWTPQFFYYQGPFGAMGEFVDNTQRLGMPVNLRRGALTVSGFNGATIADQAWELGASYVLTGEDASFTGVMPRNPLDAENRHWGAFEIAGRIEQLLIDRDTFAEGFANPDADVREAFTWVLGVNWYLNANVKLMVDWASTSFKGGAANGHDRYPESGFLSEAQVAF